MTTPFDIVPTALPPPSSAGNAARAQAEAKPVEPPAPLRAPARAIREAPGRDLERPAGDDEARQPPFPAHRDGAIYLRAGEAASSGAFLTQLIAQDAPPEPTATAAGSEAYRRAGGEPPVYSSTPVVFRIEV